MKSVSIYVPMGNEKSEVYLRGLQRTMSDIFAIEATTIGAIGHWLNASKVIVNDGIVIVTSYEMREGLIAERVEYLKAYCAAMRDDLNQDAVLMTIDEGTAILV